MGWQEIWGHRQSNFKTMNKEDVQAIFMELKRANGFDIVPGKNAPSFLDWVRAYYEHKKLLGLQNGGSVYEVGCGAGANLFLLMQDGIRIGGADYSAELFAIVKDVLAAYDVSPLELDVLEAKETPTEIKYDAVFLDSTAQYFSNEDYAQETLQRMYEKSRHAIAWLDVHDKTKEQDFIAAREQIDPDYKKHYAGLPKRFYPKDFFLQFAEEHALDIRFTPCRIPHYWNAPFTYNVYLYKHG